MSMKLYKYLSLNSLSLGSLVNHYAWYSNPDSFNDPFDGTLIPSERIRNLVLSNYKVFCLSEENDNFLLWSHYANSHHGFCIEYTDYTEDEIDLLKISGIFPKEAPTNELAIIRNAVRVEYLTNEQIQDYIDSFAVTEAGIVTQWKTWKEQGREDEYIELIQRCYRIKHKLWSYEKERRIVITKQNMNIPPGKITAIYFGMRMSQIDKRTITTIAQSKFKDNYKLYTAYRDRGKYKLKFRKFDPKIDFNELKLVNLP